MKLFHIINEQDGVNGDEGFTQWDPQYKDEAAVATHVFPFLKEKIDKINKRATKLKLPPVELKVLDKFIKTIYIKHPDDPYNPDKRIPREIEMMKVKVIGDAPKLEGYKFIATIEHQDGGNIIRTVPGEEGNEGIKSFYESQPHYCDHCKKIRRRIDTFIVKEEKTGKLRQVGSNCLKDFLGGADPKAVLWYFDNLNDFFKTVAQAEEESYSKGARAEYFVPLDHLLAVAKEVINREGYISSKQATMNDTQSTASTVRWAMMGNHFKLSDEEKAFIDAVLKPTPESENRAKEMIEWFKTLPKEQTEENEFMHNLSVIVNSGRVNSRNFGYAIALFPVFARAREQARTTQGTSAAQKSNQHVGQVGQKIPPTKITVIRTRDISGPYGNTQIVTMEDEPGNTYVWFNNSSSRMEDGREYTIVGTVKKHDDYNGKKQTNLTRVKAT